MDKDCSNTHILLHGYIYIISWSANQKKTVSFLRNPHNLDHGSQNHIESVVSSNSSDLLNHQIKTRITELGYRHPDSVYYR